MSRTAIITSLSTEVMRRLRHFGDFVTVPLAIVIFVGLAGVAAARRSRPNTSARSRWPPAW
jgi:hypothetical protein